MNAREKRLIAYLSQFQLTLRYAKAAHHYTADCLSRIFDDMDQNQIQQLRPSDHLLQEELILPISYDQARSSMSEHNPEILDAMSMENHTILHDTDDTLIGS